MSSRIRMDDAGPGDNPPAEDPQRTPPEPVERPVPDPAPAPAPTPSESPPEAAEEGGEPDKELTAAQKRIDRLNFERHEAIRQRDEMRAEYQRWIDSQRQQQAPQSSDYERGRQDAMQARVAESFNDACNRLFNAGVQEYGQEMGEARDRLNAVGWGSRPDALAAVTQLPDGHRVYRELARDLDKAARVLNLPPMAMAVELARMSNGDGERAREENAAPVSRAPEPVSRIGGHSRPAERPLDHPQTSMAEFIRRRDAQERRSRILR